ncbi:carbohydrate sulfotransferase 8-like [Podarcis raffonei]|uniref:carbohydrate sulfotransferase 8-like n=1 Tax=Podarcis raffonei TaxID=65483 RepID=UPI0023297926|nr:carbohydrate sulfotransferase 8-like [Podarcis raffonei]
MRFLARLLTLAFLGFISLLWWRHLLWRNTAQNQGRLAMEDAEEDVPQTFDSLLHIQQLRKKALRSFCSERGKITRLPPTQQEASQALSSIMVDHKLHFLYCKTPATGVEGWERLLEMLLEKNVSLQLPIPHHQQFGSQKALSEYNRTSMEAIMQSYTKVMFVREPFQRLISAYMHGMADGLNFKEFVQYILYSGTRNRSMEWTPSVSLCRPCLVRYDYVIMFGFLDNEVRHLMLRAGLPENIRIPEFIDSKIRWTYRWLEEQMLSQLSLRERKGLCHFFRFDYQAFRFPRSLLWNLTCIPGSG